MAQSKLNCPNCLKVVVTMALFFSCTFLPLKPVDGKSDPSLQPIRKMQVLGSRPPGCVNKCFSCRPCRATLVVPNSDHDHQIRKGSTASSSHGHGDADDDDTYYLLSWKCTCGNKLFQP